MIYYLYILKTIDNMLYCGIAKNPIKRFEKHISKKGAKFTISHKPEKIVYLDIFENKSLALKEEYRIKKTLSKSEKEKLIEENKNKTQEFLLNLMSN